MKYSNLISKRKQYKYSANICLDLRNEAKIADFIPNATTTEILREFLGSIIAGSSDVHSRILYGSYGTGKSHLLTVMSAVLGHINTNGTSFDLFNERIADFDKELAQDIRNYVDNSLPYLVVPIYSDYSDFGKCITYSLKKELNRNGITITFKGFFDEALNLTNKWLSGSESKKRLEEECEKQHVATDRLLNGLRSYDSLVEETFNKIYEGMSYGAKFNSANGSLLDNMDSANHAIQGKYQGIVLVFDEFGRYIEDNGENVKVKSIQDLAEYCDHSGFADYLILVSHKQLSMYTNTMLKSVSDEWKKIEGRFKATSINTKYDQCLSLIGYVIPKKEKNWNEFKGKYSLQLKELYAQAWEFKGFYLPPVTSGKDPFEDGYPLHPITLYGLDRLSKKVAQNERTFFTFLAGDDDTGLFSLLQKITTDEFHFIGLDAIYDYFEPSIKAYKADDAYAVYKKLQFSLGKLGEDAGSLSVKLLKAMSVIYIIADTDVITANRETLLNVIDADDEALNAALDILEQKKIIKYMRQYAYYDFFDSSIYDLESMFEEKQKGVTEEMVSNILNESFSDFAVYPYEYNAQFHMHRVFLPLFAHRNDLNKKSFWNLLPAYYDGAVVFVLDDRAEAKEYANIEIPGRTLLFVNADAKAIEYEVKRFVAIQYYCTKKFDLAENDPSVVNELQLYFDEQEAIVIQLIRRWRTLGDKNSFIIYDKEEQHINNVEELSSLASRIMRDHFPQTPIIINDLLNKNVLTGAIKQARKKAIDNIISQENIYEGLQNLSPEYNVIRSALSRTGISDDGTVEEDKKTYLTDEDDITYESGSFVMQEIDEFLQKATMGKAPFMELYDSLKAEPFGLRDAYIPVFIAFALRRYENVSLFFHEKENNYSSEELVKALEDAKNYSLYISNWDNTQKEYIAALEQIFAEFLPENATQNRLLNLFKAVNLHYSSISKSARTTEKYVSDMTKQYREILNKSYSDYTDFFFEILPTLNNDLQALIQQIKNIKAELGSVDDKLTTVASRVLHKVFSISDDDSLALGMKDLFEREWKDKSTKAFDYTTNAFLDYVGRVKEVTDSEMINDLARIITGFEISYWNDGTSQEFEDILTQVRDKINGYSVTDTLSDGDVKITIENGMKAPVISTFSSAELSQTGQMMLNKLETDISKFGESISYEERISILTRILKRIIG